MLPFQRGLIRGLLQLIQNIRLLHPLPFLAAILAFVLRCRIYRLQTWQVTLALTQVIANQNQPLLIPCKQGHKTLHLFLRNHNFLGAYPERQCHQEPLLNLALEAVHLHTRQQYLVLTLSQQNLAPHFELLFVLQ